MVMKDRSLCGLSPKAVLLDLDDTLIIDDALTEQAWRAACRKFAPQIGSINDEELYKVIRMIANHYWENPEQHRSGRLNLYQSRREIVRWSLSSLGFKSDELADGLADTYSGEKERAITLVPGALETLQSLKKGGVRLALLTNGSPETQRRKIERFGLAAYFDYILIEGEFGAGKPDQRVFSAALGKLNVSPAQACMVGDDLQRDIAGSQRAGIFSFWVDWRGNGLPEDTSIQPDCVIRCVPELLTFIRPGALEMR
jgi:putative hydrolase of the HAD superfamily